MTFSRWLEVAELHKPSSKVTKSKVIKDKGTNVAHSVIQFRWTTKLGNDVKLQFTPKGEDEYSVIFYVNDLLADYSSSKEGSVRDPEILSGIFYLLKTKADLLNAKKLNFTAWESPRDTKTIKNLDFEILKPKILNALNEFRSKLIKYQPQMVPHSDAKINLYKRLNKPLPDTELDLNKDMWFNFIDEVKNSINKNSNLEDYINIIKNQYYYDKIISIYPNLEILINLMQNFSNAIQSNTPRGWDRKSNRRFTIYNKILNRDFASQWDISVRGNNFELTRL